MGPDVSLLRRRGFKMGHFKFAAVQIQDYL